MQIFPGDLLLCKVAEKKQGFTDPVAGGGLEISLQIEDLNQMMIACT